MRQVLDIHDARLAGQRTDHALGVGPAAHLAAHAHDAVDHLGGELVRRTLESTQHATEMTGEKAVIHGLEAAPAQ